jgi:hypothetical protein
MRRSLIYQSFSSLSVFPDSGRADRLHGVRERTTIQRATTDQSVREAV